MNHLEKKTMDKATVAEGIVMSNKNSHRPSEAQKFLCEMDEETFEPTHLVLPNKVGARMFKNMNGKHPTVNLRVGQSCIWDVKVKKSDKTIYLDEALISSMVRS